MNGRLLAVLALVMGFLAPAGSAESDPTPNEQRLLQLVQEVQAQQAQIAANQEKIDSKMAEVSELVRVARIFAGRAGK